MHEQCIERRTLEKRREIPNLRRVVTDFSQVDFSHPLIRERLARAYAVLLARRVKQE